VSARIAAVNYILEWDARRNVVRARQVAGLLGTEVKYLFRFLVVRYDFLTKQKGGPFQLIVDDVENGRIDCAGLDSKRFRRSFEQSASFAKFFDFACGRRLDLLNNTLPRIEHRPDR
jgi:hypothetical protein